MITLIGLHNCGLSTVIAMTVNQRVNWRLTEDTDKLHGALRPLHWSCTHTLIYSM